MESKNLSLQSSSPGVAVVHFNIKEEVEEEEEEEDEEEANANTSIGSSVIQLLYILSNLTGIICDLSKFTT